MKCYKPPSADLTIRLRGNVTITSDILIQPGYCLTILACYWLGNCRFGKVGELATSMVEVGVGWRAPQPAPPIEKIDYAVGSSLLTMLLVVREFAPGCQGLFFAIS